MKLIEHRGAKTKSLWANPAYREHMSKAHIGINKGVKKPPRSAEHLKNLSLGHLGQKAWNKGKRVPQITGEKHYLWNGDKVTYFTLHSWVQRHLGKPSKCEHCGLDDSKRMYNWANKSHKYKRDLTDWIRLCVPCHRAYDSKKTIWI